MKKYNFLKLIKDKSTEQEAILEGGFIAFRNKKGESGTICITENFGVTLRLIEEAEIQKEKLKFQREQHVRGEVYNKIDIKESMIG